MLRSFRFSNHRSFRDEHELLLLPAYGKDRPAVPVAALYGANASGKSTVVDALRFMRLAVVDSYPRWEPDEGVPRNPFKLDPRARTDPSLYVVDIVIDGVRHVYGFSADDERVREEWLYAYPRGRRRVLFERQGDDLGLGASLTGARTIVQGLTRPNALFLSLASRLELPTVLPTYEWFLRALEISSGWSSAGLARTLRLHPDRADKVRELLALADLGISDMHIEPVEDPAERDTRLAWTREHVTLVDQLDHVNAKSDAIDGVTLRAEERSELEDHRRRAEIRAYPSLFFAHGAGDTLLSLGEESRGTQQWLGLLIPALEVMDRGSLLVVDEIDTSLHPMMVAQLVRLFQSAKTNPNGAQLLFTAHDTSLMGTALGAEVLARDQIWFVEKDPDGASKIFPLSDFHPRKGENPERRYLGGSYGAVPVLGDPDLEETGRRGEG